MVGLDKKRGKPEQMEGKKTNTQDPDQNNIRRDSPGERRLQREEEIHTKSEHRFGVLGRDRECSAERVYDILVKDTTEIEKKKKNSFKGKRKKPKNTSGNAFSEVPRIGRTGTGKGKHPSVPFECTWEPQDKKRPEKRGTSTATLPKVPKSINNCNGFHERPCQFHGL